MIRFRKCASDVSSMGCVNLISNTRTKSRPHRHGAANNRTEARVLFKTDFSQRAVSGSTLERNLAGTPTDSRTRFESQQRNRTSVQDSRVESTTLTRERLLQQLCPPESLEQGFKKSKSKSKTKNEKNLMKKIEKC